MSASVRIEDEAFSDRRYDLLARELGLPDADCARGKMAAIWRQCTQQQVHVLDAEIVRVILGNNGVDALVKSRLGEVVSNGVRICGTRGRIEWLAKLRNNGRKGGRPRKPNGNHLVLHSETRSEPEPNPPAPAPAPVTSQIERESESPGEREAPALAVAPLRLSPAPERAERSTRSRRRSPETELDPAWQPEASKSVDTRGLDLVKELAKFKGWAVARGRKYVNWQAAWENWLRRSVDFQPTNQPSRATDPGIRVLKEL
jgi:hypothetical protein